MNQPRAFLTITKGKEIGRQYILRPGQQFIIGRSHDLAISLPDKQVSRRHVSLKFSDKGLRICDLGSSNGTTLDGKKLNSHTPEFSCPNDLLEVGDHQFKIEVIGLDAEAENTVDRTRRIPRNFVPSEEFDILGEIGRGATGIVYGAFQKSLKRNVAVKIPRTDVENYDECLDRFVHEGQLCSQVHSPYVVTVFDMRRSGKRIYIVMELVSGGSAKDRLSNSVIPIPEIAKIGEHIATGLHAIHRMNIIHRDLKPSNILLSPEGIAKLADFGIAKKTSDDSGQWPSLTPSDEGLGTLGFVSPEGISCDSDNNKMTAASDIYSLGATLYNLITGRTPFISVASSIDIIMNKVLLEKPVPPHLVRPDCPQKLSNLIMRMMEKDPANRPASSLGVAVQLEKIKNRYHDNSTTSLQETDVFVQECVTDSF